MVDVKTAASARILDDRKIDLKKSDPVLAGFPSDYRDRVWMRMQELIWFQDAGIFTYEHFRNKRILDWEAGDGAFAVAFLLLGAKSVTAIDSWTTLEAVPAEVRSLSGFEFQQIGVTEYLTDTPEAKSSFDFIFSNTVTEHIADLPGAFDSLHLLLTTDGHYFNNHDNYYSPCGSHDHGFWYYGNLDLIEYQGVSCWEMQEKCSASEAHRAKLRRELPWTWSDKNSSELTPSNCSQCRYFMRSQEWAHIRAHEHFPVIFNDPHFLTMREGSSLNKITPFLLLQLLTEAGFEITHVSRSTVQNEPSEDLLKLGLSKLDLQTATVRTLCILKN